MPGRCCAGHATSSSYLVSRLCATRVAALASGAYMARPREPVCYRTPCADRDAHAAAHPPTSAAAGGSRLGDLSDSGLMAGASQHGSARNFSRLI